MVEEGQVEGEGGRNVENEKVAEALTETKELSVGPFPYA